MQLILNDFGGYEFSYSLLQLLHNYNKKADSCKSEKKDSYSSKIILTVTLITSLTLVRC